MSPLFPYETSSSYNPGEITRAEQLRLARVFIAGSLLPAVSDLPPELSLSNEQLENLLKTFKEDHKGQGDDFEMNSVQVEFTGMYLEYMWSSQHGNTLSDQDLVEKTFDLISNYTPSSK